MTNPPSFWDQLYDLGKVVAPWATVGVICWRIIDVVFKYFSDGRENELKKIVQAETTPKLEELEKKIDRLTDAISELKLRR